MADKAELFKMKTSSARLFYQVSLLSKKQFEKTDKKNLLEGRVISTKIQQNPEGSVGRRTQKQIGFLINHSRVTTSQVAEITSPDCVTCVILKRNDQVFKKLIVDTANFCYYTLKDKSTFFSHGAVGVLSLSVLIVR